MHTVDRSCSSSSSMGEKNYSKISLCNDEYRQIESGTKKADDRRRKKTIRICHQNWRGCRINWMLTFMMGVQIDIMWNIICVAKKTLVLVFFFERPSFLSLQTLFCQFSNPQLLLLKKHLDVYSRFKLAFGVVGFFLFARWH